MKKQFIVTIIVSLLIITATSYVFAASSSANGPDVADLGHFINGQATKPAVIFRHAEHQSRLHGDCSKCHGANNVLLNLKTGKPLDVSNVDMFNAVFHDEFCFECHDKLKNPVGRDCDSCHAGSK